MNVIPFRRPRRPSPRTSPIDPRRAVPELADRLLGAQQREYADIEPAEAHRALEIAIARLRAR